MSGKLGEAAYTEGHGTESMCTGGSFVPIPDAPEQQAANSLLGLAAAPTLCPRGPDAGLDRPWTDLCSVVPAAQRAFL